MTLNLKQDSSSDDNSSLTPIPAEYLLTPLEEAREQAMLLGAIPRRTATATTLGNGNNLTSRKGTVTARTKRNRFLAKIIIHGIVLLLVLFCIGAGTYSIPRILYQRGSLTSPVIWPWTMILDAEKEKKDVEILIEKPIDPAKDPESPIYKLNNLKERYSELRNAEVGSVATADKIISDIDQVVTELHQLKEDPEMKEVLNFQSNIDGMLTGISNKRENLLKVRVELDEIEKYKADAAAKSKKSRTTDLSSVGYSSFYDDDSESEEGFKDIAEEISKEKEAEKKRDLGFDNLDSW